MDLRVSTSLRLLTCCFVFFSASFASPDDKRHRVFPIDRNGNSNSARWEWASHKGKDDVKEQTMSHHHHGEMMEALALKFHDDGVPVDKEVKFHLYTKRNPDESQLLEIDSLELLKKSYYVKNIPTVFITHGYLNTVNVAAVTTVREAYLNGTEEVNVIAVDWSPYSISLYPMAVEKVETVGKQIARMIDFLCGNGRLRFDLTTLVGHSLGAHIMGVTGRQVTTGKINQIFGLDPAGPDFKDANAKIRISKKSARNVQIIHTNVDQLGLLDPLGHADFYPNGGSNQPGCAALDLLSYGACSHGQSFRFFAESLNSQIGFKALRCRRGEEPRKGQCRGKVALMGGRSNQINASGLYYLKTNAESPYAVQLRWKKRRY